ncbi:protein kinase [Actinomadura sp. WMMA1423]|uniref:protein kinase domain-containing protein n=1 Tax=Actinomadura sp. WMMA1423 TaxID=2591108 RepID=UPI0011465FF1|nr:protein kinase [Actinomadura sp. WMMA1423]
MVLAQRYRLDRLLGGGGMGEVWQGFDLTLRRRVAIKLIRADLRDDAQFSEQMLRRFQREANAAARLNHRNITTVHDYGEQPYTDRAGRGRLFPFLVMEHLEGTDLSSLLKQTPEGLPINQVLEYGIQACDGLAAAHEADVVHRDIKPANLMLVADGTIKICDFGIAHLPDATAGLTGHGRVLGTRGYMAPEQREGRPVDYRADLYALGATLYRLLTGKIPTTAAPGIHRDGISTDLDGLISELLADNPDDRPPSAAAIADRLRIFTHPATLPDQSTAADTGGRRTTSETESEQARRSELHQAWAEAERIARSITYPTSRSRELGWQATALTAVAKVVAPQDADRAAGLLAEAEHTARTITDPDERAWRLTGLAEAVGKDDADRAAGLLAEAEHTARTITDPDERAWTLTGLAEAVGKDDADRAAGLLAEAEHTARTITDLHDRAWTLTRVAKAVVAHDVAEAERIARSITSLLRRSQGLQERVKGLVGVAEAVAAHDAERAMSLLTEAERTARSITNKYERHFALTEVAKAVATHDVPQAERIAGSTTKMFDRLDRRWVAKQRDEALATVVEVVAAQDPLEAERIVGSITEPDDRAHGLISVAEAVGERDIERARSLLEQAEQTANSITGFKLRSLILQQRERALVKVVAAQDPLEAERIVGSITEPDDRAHGLISVAEAVGERDIERARSLLEQAEQTANSITDFQSRSWVLRRRDWALAKVAEAAGAHDPAKAERIASSIAGLNDRARALVKVAKAAAAHPWDPDASAVDQT